MANGENNLSVAANSPVELIDTGSEYREPLPGIALCLSGGGYRAMLFHVGALWRLNEAGLLGRIDRASSVSGGSIAAGTLASRWDDLDFGMGDVAENFTTQVVRPLRDMADRTID